MFCIIVAQETGTVEKKKTEEMMRWKIIGGSLLLGGGVFFGGGDGCETAKFGGSDLNSRKISCKIHLDSRILRVLPVKYVFKASRTIL